MKNIFYKCFLLLWVISAFAFHANSKSEESKLMNLQEPNSEFLAYIQKLYKETGLEAAGMDYLTFKKGIVGFYNIKSEGLVNNNKLTIVDFDKSSNSKRLWVIDLDTDRLLFNSLVAHGRKSGEAMALNFSNTNESNMSSLGFYSTSNTYVGKHGRSMVLNGLDEGFNTNAKQRCIVMHGADYVSEKFIQCNGRLGRSQGCPAVPNNLRDKIICEVKDGSVLYVNKSNIGYVSGYLNLNKAALAWKKESKA